MIEGRESVIHGRYYDKYLDEAMRVFEEGIE